MVDSQCLVSLPHRFYEEQLSFTALTKLEVAGVIQGHQMEPLNCWHKIDCLAVEPEAPRPGGGAQCILLYNVNIYVNR